MTGNWLYKHNIYTIQFIINYETSDSTQSFNIPPLVVLKSTIPLSVLRIPIRASNQVLLQLDKIYVHRKKYNREQSKKYFSEVTKE